MIWAAGAVLLGIHASTKLARLSDEWLDDYVPGWRTGAETDVGCVVGVVQLVQICRPADLPTDLRDHEFVNRDPANWCWVLSNPQRLKKPVPAKGNARLFNVDVPDHLMPEGVDS